MEVKNKGMCSCVFVERKHGQGQRTVHVMPAYTSRTTVNWGITPSKNVTAKPFGKQQQKQETSFIIKTKDTQTEIIN